jgi:hypothetical protein
MMSRHLKIIFGFLSSILASSASVDSTLAVVEWRPRSQILQPKRQELQEQEALQEVLQKSFAAQIADLALVDDLFMTFDILGERGLKLEIQKILGSNIINIPFFKVTKNGNSFFILGSNHVTSFEMLPLDVQNIILNCTTFVVERGDGIDEETPQSLLDFYRTFYDSTETWFDDLTDREQKYLDTVFSCFYQHITPTCEDLETQEYLLKQLDLKEPVVSNIKLEEISGLVTRVCTAGGMDIFMSNYSLQSSRQREFLELPEETRNRVFSPSTFQENFSELQEILDFSLERRGLLVSKSLLGVIKSYLLGKENPSADDSFSFYRVLNDNLRWYPRILTMAEKAPSETMIVTFGRDHLGRSGGVLYRLLTEGGYTATRYNSRDGWTPFSPADLL